MKARQYYQYFLPIRLHEILEEAPPNKQVKYSEVHERLHNRFDVSTVHTTKILRAAFPLAEKKRSGREKHCYYTGITWKSFHYRLFTAQLSHLVSHLLSLQVSHPRHLSLNHLLRDHQLANSLKEFHAGHPWYYQAGRHMFSLISVPWFHHLQLISGWLSKY